MPLIEINSLTFKYALSDRFALNDISLEVNEGDFCLLFGSSGCGKTTLLRHLKRELAPAGKRTGSVLYAGGDLFAKDANEALLACEIGLVMQNPDSQIVTDTVYHELAFGLENLGFDSGVIHRRVAEMASFFGIGSWFHKSTAELSGGQKQIVNLASILAMQPKLLLLDEPTSQLDPVAARDFLEMVARLNRELGITVIISEHHLENVMPQATRAVLMENGRVKYNAPPREVAAMIARNKEDRPYLESLPAAARIFSQSNKNGDTTPLTVREGRKKLKEALGLRTDLPAAYKSVADGGHKKGIPSAECRELWFKYDKNGRDIISGLSLSVYGGELLCVLGENGCGKSTLLTLLAGLRQPQRGGIKLFGRPLRSYSEKELYTGCIGYLPQNPKAVFLHDTVRKNLEGRENELPKSLDLEPLLDRHPYDLSGGEQQKAALARVLLSHPRLLLLDEPTKGLDARSKDALAEILLSLCKGGAAIVLSTHDIEFAAQYAHRCALLFDGKTACEGEPKSFFGFNCFYTTAANHIARDFDGSAITCEDVIRLCQE